MARLLTRKFVSTLFSPTLTYRSSWCVLGTTTSKPSLFSFRDFGANYYSSEVNTEVKVEDDSFVEDNSFVDEPVDEPQFKVYIGVSFTGFQEKPSEPYSVEEGKMDKRFRPFSPSHEKLYSVEEGKMDKRFRPFSPSKDVSTYKKGSFEDLFRNSSFARTRTLVDKDVEGIIIAVNNRKMYVDFGGKFHGVSNLPEDSFGCHVGARVVVTVKELEAVGHFIGDSKHHSLMEAAIQFKRLI